MVRKAVGESDVSGTLLGCSGSSFFGCTTGKPVAETGVGGAYSLRGCGGEGEIDIKTQRYISIQLRLRGHINMTSALRVRGSKYLISRSYSTDKSVVTCGQGGSKILKILRTLLKYDP